ncbi:MAG TPA: ABC transporter substrate-binding protein [Thermoplasmata archaeon]|nr:ABC transporter substrate-binding protein [Thermoplasmata archaeon]
MEEQQGPSGETAKPAPKSKALWIAIAVIVVIIVVVVAAALGGLFAPAGKPALRIGTLLSLTGGLSPYGPGDTKGANLAVEEINAAGGVLGEPVQIYNEDDQTQSTAAAAATTKLITQNHVNAIVGAQFSGGTLASIDIAATNGVVMVSPSATSVKLSDLSVTKGWFFRTISSDALQGAVAGSYLYTNSSFRYANAMAINNPYGVGLAANFKAKFTALTGIVNDTVIIPEAQTDYTSALTQLFSTNPEVVYFVAYPDTGLTVMKQWQAGLSTHPSWNKQWVFSEGLDDQTFVDSLRDPAVGVDVTRIWGTAPASPNSTLYNAFAARYEARFFNQVPVLYASHAYDAVYMIALAAQKAGAVDGASIKSQLRAVSGPNGTVINGGQWSKALTELAAGHAINWEGSAGSENLNATNDPGRGSYEVWGVSASPNFKIYRLAYFGESLVQPAAAVADLNVLAPQTNIFVSKIQAVAISRQD